MWIKNFQQNIKNFFLTNSLWRKIKNINNGFVKPILLRFFLGFTKYVGDLNHLQRDHFPEKHGWVLEFSDKNNDYIKNVLVLENAKQCPLLGRYIFGKELLLY
jgi:hypothetical protein